MGEWISRAASKEEWRWESVRRRERRILLSLLYSWRQWEKALEEVDMVCLFSGSARRWGGKGGVEFLIVRKGRLGIFEIPLRDPRIFFGRVSLPLDQEEVVSQSSVVAKDLFDLVFFFSLDKIRWWHREVLSVDGVFFVRG